MSSDIINPSSARLDRRAFVATGVLAGAAALGAAPSWLARGTPNGGLDLAATVPSRVGGWMIDARAVPIMPDAAMQASVARAYDQVLARVYRQNDAVMMLVIAEGTQRSGTIAAHRPTTCYAAQGFAVTDERTGALPPPFAQISTAHVFARQGEREEAIAYWITIDGKRTGAGFAQKLGLLRATLMGKTPLGFLVRASTFGPDDSASYARVDTFLAALLEAMQPAARRMIAGGGA